MYITFDNYYEVDDYNSFKTAAKNNGVVFEEYLSMKTPYMRYLKIDDRRDLPAFVNYDFASASLTRWLISTVKPTQPNEAYILKRRAGKDVSYWNYITPKPLEKLSDKKYIMVFKSMDFTELSQISKQLNGAKIYKWGKAKIKKYNIYYTFNPYIRGLVSENNVLMEFGDGASMGLKNGSSIPKIKGELEYMLNTFVLVKEKLEDKTLEAEYWQSGKIHPLKRTTFI